MPIQTYIFDVEGERIEVRADNAQAAQAMAAAQYLNGQISRQFAPPPMDVRAGAPHAAGRVGGDAAIRSAAASQPSNRPALPLPDPRSPGAVGLWAAGAGANLANDLVQNLTGHDPRQAIRSTNPAIDAVMGFANGAVGTAATTVGGLVDPQSAINGAQSTVNHLSPVLQGLFNHSNGDQQSATIRALEESRRNRGDLTTGERIAPMMPNYAPSTGAGEFAGRAGAAAPYMLMPGGQLPTILGFGAGEAAGAAAQAGGANPDQVEAARFGGNTAGAFAALPFTGARPSERVLRNATVGPEPILPWQRRSPAMDLSDAPGSDLNLAVALMRRSRALPNDGINVYGDEALAQVTGPRAGALQTVVRQASRAPEGSRRAAAQLAGRPDEIRNATMGVADQIAPPVVDPAALAVRAQQGAGDALTAIRRDINTQARPHYDALENQLVPGGEFAELLRNTSFRQALSEVRNDPILNQRIRLLPNNSMATVNEVFKRMSRNETATEQSPTNPAGDNTAAGVHAENEGAARAVIDGLINSGQLPPDFNLARELVARGRQTRLEPAVAGPLGDIAGSGRPAAAGVQAQSAALYPAAPPEGMPAATVAAIRALDGQQPGVAGALTRSHLVDALEQGMRRVQGGDNPRGGANVANRLAGNHAAENTFLAGVNEVAPGAVGATDDLVRVLRATGTRAPEGSQTATDVTGMSDLGAGELPMEAFRAAVSPHQLPGRWNNMLDRWQVNSNAGEIMRVLGLPPDEFAAYMRNLPNAGGRNRNLGLAKALLAAQAMQQQGEPQ